MRVAAPPPRRAFRLPDWAAWGGLCLAVLAFFLKYALRRQPERIGDGWEYVVMACNWARSFTPWVVKENLVTCAREANWSPEQALAWFFHHPRVGYDTYHFWLLSFFAAPFSMLCRWVGASQFYAFPLLHLAITLFVAWRLVRVLGQARAACLLLIMACSPLIFWSNKAHSEFFVISGVLLAFAVLYRGRTLEAAFWLGLVSNQQLTLAPFAVGLVGLWFLSDRSRLLRWRAWLSALPSLVAPLLCVVYSELRYGVPSPLTRSNNYSDASVRRALSLFIDPDIGLFPNWPLGLALAFAAVVCAGLLRKEMRGLKGMAVFTACWCILLPFFMTVQVNWNSGGTIYISRYALYQIPPIVVWFTVLVFRLADRFAPGPHSLRVVVAAAAAVLLVMWIPYSRNFATFYPDQGERANERTPLAEWLYARWPALYDPPPEVFLERTLNTELPSQYYRAGTWAVSNVSCSKLLLVRSVAEMRKMAAFDKPIGCYRDIEYRDIAERLVSGKMQPTPLGYINLE